MGLACCEPVRIPGEKRTGAAILLHLTAKAQQIEFILRHHGLAPGAVIFVGESLIDYEFVKGKGVRFIALRRLFEEHANGER